MAKSNKKKSLVKLKYEFGTEDPIDPITGLPIKKGLEGAKNMGIDVFNNILNAPVPVRPGAEDQSLYAIDESKNSPNPQSKIIPLNEKPKEEDNTLENIELGSALGITAINAYFNKQQQGKENRKDRRAAIMQDFFVPVVNPYPEGTGSQAIMKKGGRLPSESQGINIFEGGKGEVISSNNHSNPMIEFTGKEHKDGGINIQYGNKSAEIENKEIGWVDNDGGLNIFGKLKMPGTNQTFRSIAKDMAKKEEKVDGMMSKYTNILTNGNEADVYQQSAISTAKVMFKSLDKQSKEIASKKEALASYQGLILSMLPKEEKMEKGGEINPKDPSAVQAIIDKYSGGKSPLKAEDFIEVANKYGVPLDLMLAQAIGESNIGTKGRAVRSKNIFNVGNTDDGSTEYQNDWKAGLERYAKLLKNEYSVDGKIDTNYLLSSDFTRPKRGGKYAKDGYNKQIFSILNQINPNNGYTMNTKTNTGNPGDEFKQFKGRDGKQYNSPQGLKPSVFYKDPEVEKALIKDQTFPKAGADKNWGPEHDAFWNSLPQAKRDELLNKSSGASVKNSSISTGGGGDKTQEQVVTDPKSFDYVPKYEPINKNQDVIDTPYGPAKREAAPFSDKVNIGTGDRARGYLSSLALEQIAPELLTIATNKREPVEQLTYQPDLKQTFDISYQLGRNENQSTFNQVAKIAEQTGNIDALSQMAAQKYNADQQYNMQEVQGNAQQKLGVYGQNIDTLNDAKVKNLALIADQQNKQAAAKFNTRKEDIAAITSVSGKVLQNNLENKTYNAYANLFKHYGFDKKGNVTFNPDEVTQRFSPGEAAQFGMLSAQQGASAIMNGDFSRQFKNVKNSDGSTTTTETLGKNKQIQEEYKVLKNQGFDDGIIGNMLRAKYPETISNN